MGKSESVVTYGYERKLIM